MSKASKPLTRKSFKSSTDKLARVAGPFPPSDYQEDIFGAGLPLLPPLPAPLFSSSTSLSSSSEDDRASKQAAFSLIQIAPAMRSKIQMCVCVCRRTPAPEAIRTFILRVSTNSKMPSLADAFPSHVLLTRSAMQPLTHYCICKMWGFTFRLT